MKSQCKVLVLLALVGIGSAAIFRAKVGGYDVYGPGNGGYTAKNSSDPYPKKGECADAIKLTDGMLGDYKIKISNCRGACAINQFECFSGGACLCYKHTCDSTNHCADGSDEGAFCQSRPASYVAPACLPAVQNGDIELEVTVDNAEGVLSNIRYNGVAAPNAEGSFFFHDYGNNQLKVEIYAHDNTAWDLEVYSKQVASSAAGITRQLKSARGLDNGYVAYVLKDNKAQGCNNDVVVRQIAPLAA